jgi:hypothetical protein
VAPADTDRFSEVWGTRHATFTDVPTAHRRVRRGAGRDRARRGRTGPGRRREPDVLLRGRLAGRPPRAGARRRQRRRAPGRRRLRRRRRVGRLLPDERHVHLAGAAGPRLRHRPGLDQRPARADGRRHGRRRPRGPRRLRQRRRLGLLRPDQRHVHRPGAEGARLRLGPGLARRPPPAHDRRPHGRPGRGRRRLRRVGGARLARPHRPVLLRHGQADRQLRLRPRVAGGQEPAAARRHGRHRDGRHRGLRRRRHLRVLLLAPGRHLHRGGAEDPQLRLRPGLARGRAPAGRGPDERRRAPGRRRLRLRRGLGRLRARARSTRPRTPGSR